MSAGTDHRRDRLFTRDRLQRVKSASKEHCHAHKRPIPHEGLLTRDRLLTRGQFQRVEGFQGTVPGDRLLFVRDSE